MAVEMAIWRMTDSAPRMLTSSTPGAEKRIEDILIKDPSLWGTNLLVLGRQVKTSFGVVMDVLALDEEGRAHVLELKRGRTGRDVVGQVLDYGSWVENLSLEDLEEIYLDFREGEEDLDEAFADHFGRPLPEVVNAEQQLTIIASELDPTSDRIVEFLAESYGVPINAVFFRHFKDGEHEYLARTWLLDPHRADAQASRLAGSKRRPWNGRDFYVVLGQAGGGDQRWLIARKYGYLNAGGGKWYWETLERIRPGQRVFAYVAGAGYVGIGKVIGEMMLARDAEVEVNGKPQLLLDQPGLSPETREGMLSDDPDLAERVVQVEWISTRPVEKAIGDKNLFSHQRACKLYDEHTIKTVESAFEVDEAIG